MWSEYSPKKMLTDTYVSSVHWKFSQPNHATHVEMSTVLWCHEETWDAARSVLLLHHTSLPVVLCQLILSYDPHSRYAWHCLRNRTWRRIERALNDFMSECVEEHGSSAQEHKLMSHECGRVEFDRADYALCSDVDFSAWCQAALRARGFVQAKVTLRRTKCEAMPTAWMLRVSWCMYQPQTEPTAETADVIDLPSRLSGQPRVHQVARMVGSPQWVGHIPRPNLASTHAYFSSVMPLNEVVVNKTDGDAMRYRIIECADNLLDRLYENVRQGKTIHHCMVTYHDPYLYLDQDSTVPCHRLATINVGAWSEGMSLSFVAHVREELVRRCSCEVQLSREANQENTYYIVLQLI